MHSDAIMMTVLTHPLHVLLIGMIFGRLVRTGVAATVQARHTGSKIHPAPAADLSEIRAA